jgi:hypothetical protein
MAITVERLRHVWVRLRLSRQAMIEHDARILVQKIARETAAVHAANVARLERRKIYIGTAEAVAHEERIAKLDRNARNARVFRESAVVALRRTLGLPDDPTQAECGDWGEAP